MPLGSNCALDLCVEVQLGGGGAVPAEERGDEAARGGTVGAPSP